MGVPAGYELRAPRPEDLDGVGAVLIADDLDDAGRPVLDAGFVRDEWARPSLDLATGAWVVVDGSGGIVGYGQAVREEPDIVDSWGVVHPGHRGRGVGSSLMDRIEERASELLSGRPSSRFRHAINAGDRAAAAMLTTRGLRPIRHFWHMEIALAGPLPPDPAPEGTEIRPVEPHDDLPPVHAVLSEAFADDWSGLPGPFDRWAEEQTTSPSYDPTLWLLASVEGRPVGALTAKVSGDRGWVVELGVRPGSRGRGIGGALLRRSFATFARRGIRRVLLNVDAENPTEATALYERAGMRVVKRWDLWERWARGESNPHGLSPTGS